MERKLVVGIRDFCILSKGLSGREREGKLTREALSVLMAAQKTTRRRVEWIKCGLFTPVGFFVWSTPHCTVCPARWLVSSSSVCNPSSDPFVKSYSSPSSFTLCNIFWGILLPKTEQKDHFFVSFSNFQTLKPTVVMGSRDQVLRFNLVLLHSFTPENLKSISWVEVVKRTQQNSHMETYVNADTDFHFFLHFFYTFSSLYFSFHLFLSLFILHRFSTFQSCSLPSSQERSLDK